MIGCEGERVTSIHEKSGSGPGVINAEIYVLKRDIGKFVPAPPCSIERDIFPALVKRGRIFGRIYEGTFIDIGIPEDFARVQKLFAKYSDSRHRFT